MGETDIAGLMKS